VSGCDRVEKASGRTAFAFLDWFDQVETVDGYSNTMVYPNEVRRHVLAIVVNRRPLRGRERFDDPSKCLEINALAG